MRNNEVYQSILSVRAAQEIAESWKWYEERQQSLGDKFVKDVLHRLHQIEQFPERYPCRYKTYHEVMIENFPYKIIYKISKKKKLIQIISVFHASRNPKKKYN